MGQTATVVAASPFETLTAVHLRGCRHMCNCWLLPRESLTPSSRGLMPSMFDGIFVKNTAVTAKLGSATTTLICHSAGDWNAPYAQSLRHMNNNRMNHHEHTTRRSASADRECASNSNIALSYGAKCISVLNRLGVDPECDRQTV